MLSNPENLLLGNTHTSFLLLTKTDMRQSLQTVSDKHNNKQNGEVWENNWILKPVSADIVLIQLELK